MEPRIQYANKVTQSGTTGFQTTEPMPLEAGLTLTAARNGGAAAPREEAGPGRADIRRPFERPNSGPVSPSSL
jgi:hypothetical protein